MDFSVLCRMCALYLKGTRIYSDLIIFIRYPINVVIKKTLPLNMHYLSINSFNLC